MKFRLLFTALLLLPNVLLAAEPSAPIVYVIKPGDTLSGISERFVNDPKYWPNLWAENGQITNPNFIYPGQKLSISLPGSRTILPDDATPAAMQKKMAAAPAGAELEQVRNSSGVGAVAAGMGEAAAEKTYTLYGTEGFLAEKNFHPYGTVIGSQHDRIVLGVDDIVYTDIGGAHNASGDKFSVFSRDVAINHPRSNEEMGHKMIPLGTLQLTDVDERSSRAIITSSFREISPGAFLLPYRERQRREIPLKNSTINLKGYILDTTNGISIIGAGDVVYVDLGTSQGVEAGNLLYIVRDVKIDQRYVEGRIDRLPSELLGALVILETGKKTSTALVVKSIDTIFKGDRIINQTK